MVSIIHLCSSLFASLCAYELSCSSEIHPDLLPELYCFSSFSYQVVNVLARRHSGNTFEWEVHGGYLLEYLGLQMSAEMLFSSLVNECKQSVLNLPITLSPPCPRVSHSSCHSPKLPCPARPHCLPFRPTVRSKKWAMSKRF